MRKIFLFAAIVSSLVTTLLLIVFISGLVRYFQTNDGPGNPIPVALIIFGPSILIAGFAAWACWMYYADEPVFPRKRRRKGSPEEGNTSPRFWSDILNKSHLPKDDTKKEDKGSSHHPG